MGEATQAHVQQAPAYHNHQDSSQLTSMIQSQDKTHTALGEHPSGAPFYSQFDGFQQASRAPQHDNPYPNYQHQQSMHRLDMGSIGLALPEFSSPSASIQGFAQHASPYTNLIPVQPSGMNFGPRVPPDGSQAYPSNLVMDMPVPRTQAHRSFAPQYYYSTYGVPHPQVPVKPQGQPIPGYLTMPGMPYGKSNLAIQQKLSQPYSVLPRRGLATQPTPSYPRGPPRKPRQSGHALWVGNLPPGTTIGALKDHFSREATTEIESLFLISKSNCAFVNYRTEAACAAAMARFHESRFQGVRLVCRPRRGTPTGGSSATTPDSLTPGSGNETDKPLQKERPKTTSGPVIVDSSAIQLSKKQSTHENPEIVGEVDRRDGTAGFSSTRVLEKYFVVKSLTLQDLEASVRNGVWATQSHNEVTLNHAYETADNVFLIFSANKSGEYFGYARMLSPIASSPSLASTPHPKPKDIDNGPKSIPTPATQWAPKGRIVDDSARGTIFWEVDLSDPSHPTPDSSSRQETKEEETAVSGPETQHQHQQEWGKSFKIGWISTTRLPFYRTRGLRNPWNENREVKIARDGTEIEPSIGQRLVQMFHRPAQLARAVSVPLVVAAVQFAA